MTKPSGRWTGLGAFLRCALAASGILLGALALVCVVWFTSYVWFALLIAILLALFLRGLSDRVERWVKIRQPWALVVTLIGGAILLAAAGWLLFAPISDQFQQLQQQLPQALDRTWHRLLQSPLGRYLPAHKPSSESMMSVSKSVAPVVANVFKLTLTALAGALVVIFMGLYMAFDPGTYIEGAIRLMPISQRPRTREILHETGHVLSRWMFGQLISMTCVGTLIGLGLCISGVPLSLALGIIAGVLDIIPIIGPIVASIPAILLGFTVGPWHALFAIAVFVGANQIEGHLLLPIIHRYTVWLPPALTLFALSIMATLFGVIGALLATPITAVLLVLMKRLYLEDVLGDTGETRAAG